MIAEIQNTCILYNIVTVSLSLVMGIVIYFKWEREREKKNNNNNKWNIFFLKVLICLKKSSLAFRIELQWMHGIITIFISDVHINE